MQDLGNREENKLKVFGNKALNREFGIKMREMMNVSYDDIAVKCGPLIDRQTRSSHKRISRYVSSAEK
jgi:hypothetical protein